MPTVYRFENSPNNRAGCQNSACKAEKIKIKKGELRFGSWVEIPEYGASWKWKHWGCVTPLQISKLQKMLDGLDYDDDKDMDVLDGWDELADESRDRVRQALKVGHVADEEWRGSPELNRPGMKGINKRTPKKKADGEINENVEEAPTPSKPKKSRAKKVKAEVEDIDVDETGQPVNTVKAEDRDEEEIKPKPRSRAKKVKAEEGEEVEVKPKPKSRVKKVRTEPADDEDEAMPKPKARGKKVKAEPVDEDDEVIPKPKARGRKVKAESIDGDNQAVADPEEKPKRSRKRKSPDDEDEAAPPPPAKAKKVRKALVKKVKQEDIAMDEVEDNVRGEEDVKLENDPVAVPTQTDSLADIVETNPAPKAKRGRESSATKIKTEQEASAAGEDTTGVVAIKAKAKKGSKIKSELVDEEDDEAAGAGKLGKRVADMQIDKKAPKVKKHVVTTTASGNTIKEEREIEARPVRKGRMASKA